MKLFDTVISKVTHFVQYALGTTEQQKTLRYYQPLIAKIDCQDNAERLNAQLLHHVELYDVKGIQRNKIEESRERLDTDVDIAIAADPYIKSVHVDLIESAKRLSPIYASAFERNTTMKDKVYPFFHIACELDVQLRDALSPFVAVQPITKPVDNIHVLKVETTKKPTPQVEYVTKSPKYDGISGQRLKIRILREKVEAYSRKYRARLNSDFGVFGHLDDIDGEIDKILIKELVCETTVEMLERINQVASKHDITLGDTDSRPALVDLSLKLQRHANIIAQRTRRGSGNFIIVSPAMLSLMALDTKCFSSITPVKTDVEDLGLLAYCGTSAGNIKVYCNVWANDDAPIIMGYKGPTDVDAGMFFCPYIPVQDTGVLLDPNTGEHVTGFIQRAGWYNLRESETTLAGAEHYYSVLNVTNLQEVIDDAFGFAKTTPELDPEDVGEIKVKEAVAALQAEDAIDPQLAKMLATEAPKPAKKKRKNKKRK